MLPISHRLPAFEIPQVMKQGTRVVGNGITLICTMHTDSRLRGNDKKESRFAFIVGTNVDKRATRRNRVRRLMRESAQHALPSMARGIDCIVIGSRALIGKTQQDVEKEVASVLQKAGLLTS